MARTVVAPEPPQNYNANKRNVRVDDALWDRALNLAYIDGVTVSDVVREALAQYVARRESVIRT